VTSLRSRSIFLLVWLGLAALAPACAAGAADAVLAEVSAALAAGQYADAVTVAGTGLDEPGLDTLARARLLVVRGLGRQALGANDDALADFTQALSTAALPPPERARALFARGVSLDSLNRLDDAAGDYSAVLKLVPGATYALNNRANVRRRQGRLDEARRDYLAALNGSNSNPQYPYFGLGRIAEAQGDPSMARGYYNRALAAAPGFALARERLAALGPPAAGDAPADTGIIVLKPPPPRRTPAIVLKPPPARTPYAVTLHPPSPERFMAAAAARSRQPVSPPGRGVPLRSAIVENKAAGTGGALAQLGAWRSEEEARDGWAMAQDSAGGLLKGLAPVIVRADIPGRGVFWRLRTAPGQPVAQFCAALAQKGLACIPARD
jgi:tetratricopeptide (TPR) repeat protein